MSQGVLVKDPGQETETKVVWPCLRVFWFSEDDPTGQSSRTKEKKGRHEK